MSIVMFPKNPSGPRGGDTFVVALPQIRAQQGTPQLFRRPDPDTEKLIDAEVKAVMDTLATANRHVDRLVELLRPYRLDGQQ